MARENGVMEAGGVDVGAPAVRPELCVLKQRKPGHEESAVKESRQTEVAHWLGGRPDNGANGIAIDASFGGGCWGPGKRTSVDSSAWHATASQMRAVSNRVWPVGERRLDCWQGNRIALSSSQFSRVVRGPAFREQAASVPAVLCRSCLPRESTPACRRWPGLRGASAGLLTDSVGRAHRRPWRMDPAR